MTADVADFDPSRRKPRRDDAKRTPPHDLAAEESLLGAMLLSPAAITAVAGLVDPASFYKPAHGLVYEAITAVAGRGHTVDAVTVSAELEQRDQLDKVGGSGILLALQAATPGTGAAARYAAIVAERAELRSWLAASAEVAGIAFEPGTTDMAVVRERIADVLARTVRPPVDGGTIEWTDLGTIDLDAPAPEPAWLTRTDGQRLLYAGKVHAVHGEPSTGKSWIGLAACAEAIAAGEHVVYLDFEDSPEEVARRLIELGCSPTAVAGLVHYGRPWGPVGPGEQASLRRWLDLKPAIVVIDGVAEALDRQGLDEDSNREVIRWMDTLPRPCARAGAAVLLIDHVAKDPQQRGRYARGAGGKLAAIDGATYSLTVDQAFDREHVGRLKLHIAKDRPGGVGPVGKVAAVLHVEPSGRGQVVRMRFDPDTTSLGVADQWKPTLYMEKVSIELERSSSPLTIGALTAMVRGDKGLVREAIHRLIAEEFAVKTKGPSGHPGYRSYRPYRADLAHTDADVPPADDEIPPMPEQLHLPGRPDIEDF